MYRASIVILVAAALSAPTAPTAAADAGTDDPLSPPRLADGLLVATPAQVQLDAGRLIALLRTMSADPHKDLNSILVARQGRLVLEAYFNGATRASLHDVRSAGKSLTSTLVGLAIHDGRIANLEQPLGDFFPQAAASPAGKAGLTIRALLEMRSGIAVDDFADTPDPHSEDQMDRAPDPLAFALTAPMAAVPGTRSAYASMNTMILGRIVSAATGRDLEDYARDKLFEPLGFGPHRWTRDRSGQVLGQGSLFLRPRDLLKFGLLFLQRGQWQGRQLVPAAWVAQATTARTRFATVNPRNGLGDLYEGYGYQWWTGSESVGSKTVSFFFASGNGGQKLFVLPELEMVVVTTSAAYQKAHAHRRAHAILRQSLAAVAAAERRSRR